MLIDVDLVGTFTMCHAAIKHLKKGGVIINISATLHYTASWYQIHVSAAKAAVDSLTRSLTLEWGIDYGIRISGIAPGPIDDTAGVAKLIPDDIRRKREESALYRMGKKWDIAMAALYLASDAGNYVNGITMVVDGGIWLRSPRHLLKEDVRGLSKVVEKRSRDAPVRVPIANFEPKVCNSIHSFM